jgi:hypothetical protein
MSSQPTLTPQADVPPEVRDLCTRVNQVAEGLPVLIYLPNQDYSRIYPLVVIRDDNREYARLVDAYLNGERMQPPTKAMKRQQELPLEAIHAAADYLPAIVFLPAGKKLHPINLVPETVPEQLQPCYLALQQAQKTTIGKAPIDVSDFCEID